MSYLPIFYSGGSHTFYTGFQRASSVREALRLDEQIVTPVVESDTDAEQAPDQCIVLEDGRLIGFFDVTVLPQWMPSRRGEDENLPSGEPVLELRSLVAEFPEQVQLQAVFSLLVSLSASPTPETGLALPLALPLGTSVDIVVQPRRGLVLEGNSEGTLVVSVRRKPCRSSSSCEGSP